MVVESDALNNFRRPCVAEDFDAGGHSRPKSGKGSFNPNATACDVRHRLVAYRLANQPTVAGHRRGAARWTAASFGRGSAATAGGRIEDDVVATEPGHRNPFPVLNRSEIA